MTPDIEQLCREALADNAAATPVPWHVSHLFRLECDVSFVEHARTREPLLAEALLAERKETERLRAALVAETRLASERWAREASRRIDERDALKAECDAAEQSAHEWREQFKATEFAVHSVCDERDALEAKLAAMTAARDEACDLAECIVGEPPARIAELRAVGKEQP